MVCVMLQQPPKFLSFVIPVYNERETLAELVRQIKSAIAGLAERYEIIFIDDGSRDGSAGVMGELAREDENIRVIRFGVNYGKATALDAGFRRSRGDVVFTMDADLQDDPSEIPNFLAKLAEGYDLVSGWKKVRHDPWHKTLPSKVFNFVVSRTSGIRLHDFNCGFKAYRGDLARRLSIYGELHRFMPVLGAQLGGRVTEIAVKHNPRRFGQSKYGWSRLPKGFFDLMTVMVTTKYLKRPMHFFGAYGLLSSVVGALMLAYLVALWFVGVRPIGDRPLLLFGILFVLVGIQLFSLGIIAELFVRFFQKSEAPVVVEERGFAPEERAEAACGRGER